METIEIKRVSLNEIDQLQTIGKYTFYETFAISNTEENMKMYLENGFSIEKLTTQLSDDNVEFYFAKLGNKVIGYLKINFGASKSQFKEDNAMEIERIYVLKEFHGKKIGQILCDKAIEIAIQKKSDYVWLGVWEENGRAIRFYRKNGFREFGKRIFKLGNDEQKDLIMKVKLNN